MVEIYRQGDILLAKVKSIPIKAKEKMDNVILKGEVTGHAHCIEAGTIYVCNELLYIQAYSNAKVVHDEHAPITLPEGNYKVIRQREYVDQINNKSKKVFWNKKVVFWRWVSD